MMRYFFVFFIDIYFFFSNYIKVGYFNALGIGIEFYIAEYYDCIEQQGCGVSFVFFRNVWGGFMYLYSKGIYVLYYK